MRQVGAWMDAWWRYIAAHWREHVGPGLVIGLVSVIAPLVALLGGLAALWAWGCLDAFNPLRLLDHRVSRPSMVDPVDLLGGSATALLIVAGTALATEPMLLGYFRGTIRSIRGTPMTIDDLWWGYRRIGTFLEVLLGVQLVTLAGLLLLLLPGIAAAFLASMALPALADRDRGALDALRSAWALSKRHWAPILGFHLAILLISGIVSSVPILGWLAFLPCVVTMQAVAWVEKAGELDAV